MRLDRRAFLGAAAVGAGCAGARKGGQAPGPGMEELGQVASAPVLRLDGLTTPVVIQSIRLLKKDKEYFVHVRSKDGAEGISLANPPRPEYLTPILQRLVNPFFIGKDARELESLLWELYRWHDNYKLYGLALWSPQAWVEFAILDMLGRISRKPVGALIGEIHNPAVGVYVATEWREKPVEESIELIKGAVAEYDSRALKIKVGGLMFMTADMYAVGPPGRTERMIPLVRKTFGNEMALYADSNSFYSVKEAIRVGRLLEEYKYRYFEEPVMFDQLEDIKQVADELTIPIANGEQDYSFHGFRWLIANDGIEIVQPDNYYFGGLIRSMKVARMAQAFGKSCTPHMSGGGLGYLYNIHFVSAVPNAGEHHEFKGTNTNVRFECKTSPLKVTGGKIQVPTGPGFGADFDPEWVKKHQPV